MSSGREEKKVEGRGGLRRETMEVGGGGRTGVRRGAGEGGRERKGGR